jgi:DNA-directed RNA polymerase III subunit RPC1
MVEGRKGDDRKGDEPSATNKLHVRGNDSLKRVSHVQFCLMSAEDMRRTAEFQVVSSELYTIPSRAPAKSGCLDPRLGVNDKMSVCATCNAKLEHCPGHFGYIKLALPVFHIGFFKHTLNFLQCVCKSCARVLLTDYEKERIIRRMRHPNTDSLAKAAIFKSVIAKCKKAKRCPGCTAVNGTVKKLTGQATLKLIHERYVERRVVPANMEPSRPPVSNNSNCPCRISVLLLAFERYKSDEDEYEDFRTRIDSAAAANQDIATLSSSVTGEDLLPTVVLDLFKKISDSDCELLWMEALVGRPEDLILQHMLVPPVPMRPSAQRQGGSNEDDLTVKLQEIIDVNIALQLSLASGPQTRTIMEQWDLLTTHCAQYINGETPGIQRPIGSKPMRGLCQRLKGKQGRFRQNLSGKRVDFSARTVISPDPNLRVDQVGVPRKVAMIMTFPEVVSDVNIEKMRRLVRNGPAKHPGANMIRLRDGSFTKFLAFCNLETAAQNLRIGDVVERHMEDNDVVLFNRQPSLHKISIMAHRAKILEWQTFRFNICVCAPYNADFDGE